MSFHHHNNHHHATQPCCCQPPSHHPPPPQQPPSSGDPFLIATIVSQILHPQTPPITPPPPPPPPDIVPSLLRRIQNLETSLARLSSSSSSSSSYSLSSSSYYLKDAAARVIQIHFRVFLVRRSRTLRLLKLLANVKSTFIRLQSSFSLGRFVDFVSISHDAMDLLLLLDSIQGEDQMIRDSKKSITREITQFLEMIDEVCVKRHQVTTRKIKTTRVVRNDRAMSSRVGKGYLERVEGSRGRNVDDHEKKMIENLRKRVERIGKMSRALENEEVEDDQSCGTEDLGDEDGATPYNTRTRYGLNNGGTSKGRNVDDHDRNVDDHEKKVIGDLRERVERIGKMSRALENEELEDDQSRGTEDLGDEDGATPYNTRNKYGLNNGGTSKGQNVDGHEKKVIKDLRERVERIGKMSRALENEEIEDDQSRGTELLGDEDGTTLYNARTKSGLSNGGTTDTNGRKRVCFVEDGGKIVVARDVDEIEDATKGRQDEEEEQSDGEQSSLSSEEARGSRSSEVNGSHAHDQEFTFPAAQPLMMEPKVNFLTRKRGLKIAE